MQCMPFIYTKDQTLYIKAYSFTNTFKHQACLIKNLSVLMPQLCNTKSFAQSYRWMPAPLFITGLRAPAFIKPTGICHWSSPGLKTIPTPGEKRNGYADIHTMWVGSTSKHVYIHTVLFLSISNFGSCHSDEGWCKLMHGHILHLNMCFVFSAALHVTAPYTSCIENIEKIGGRGHSKAGTLCTKIKGVVVHQRNMIRNRNCLMITLCCMIENKNTTQT